MGILDGKVAIVTGAGQGIGRNEALELAAQGAAVIVNDLGTAVDGGTEAGQTPADEVVAAIRALGGQTSANYGDVADWDAARELVEQAISQYGRLDILVNNAGILRRGHFLDLSEGDFDAVLRVHVKGAVATMQHACSYWRAEHLAGRKPAGSVINTASRAGLAPSRRVKLAWYSAAKSAVAMLTMAAAVEMEPFGVRVNAVAPRALTRMYAFSRGESFEEGGSAADGDGAATSDHRSDCIGSIVAWLASDEASGISGQIFSAEGDLVRHYKPWRPGSELRIKHGLDSATLAELRALSLG